MHKSYTCKQAFQLSQKYRSIATIEKLGGYINNHFYPKYRIERYLCRLII